MKTVYSIIRDTTKPHGTIYDHKGLKINYIGLTESGMETYLILFDNCQGSLKYHREKDTFYEPGWVEVKE